MDARLLMQIANAPVDITPQYDDTNVTLFSGQPPLHGMSRITTSRERMTAEIDDTEQWESQRLRELPAGTINPVGEVFGTRSGRFVHPNNMGRIIPNSGLWEASDVSYFGHRSHLTPGKYLSTFRFSVGSLEIKGPAYGSDAAVSRYVYSGGEWYHATEFHDRPLIVTPLTQDATSLSEETLSITVEGTPDEIDSEAVWLFGSFISGNRLGSLLREYYASDGSLISRLHRRGRPGSGRHQFFRPFYAPFSPEGMHNALDGLSRLLRDDFPIDVILDHIFQAVTGTMDTDAVHLILAYHTAIEAWNRAHGFQSWIDTRPWRRFASHIVGDLVPPDLYATIGFDVQRTLRGAVGNANRTTTAWWQDRLFEDLGIDVSSEDARRILNMRNELLHNGYFLTPAHDLSFEELQQRRDDVERLRRLAFFVVCRLAGYFGAFLDPVTFAVHQIPRQADGMIIP